MDLSLGVLIVAFALTAAMVKMLQPVAYWLELVDKPGGRKRHEGLIPLIGGISIFIGTFLTGYVFLEQPTFIRLFMIGGGFIVFLGAIDDRYDISARLRLVGQVLVAAIFVYGLDIYLANFGDLLGIGDIRVGWLGYPLAILSLVFIHFSQTGIITFNYADLLTTELAPGAEYALMLGFFIAFAVKFPVVPVHSWLPDAHVEAPTGGSVLLAGVMLKLGTYGLMRFNLSLFPQTTVDWVPVMAVLAVIGIIYGAVVAIVGIALAGVALYFYLSLFAGYSSYGAIGTVMALLFALWIFNMVLLLGMEVDAELERARELQSGIEAEANIQLPPRDTGRVEKMRQTQEDVESEGRTLRISKGKPRRDMPDQST